MYALFQGDKQIGRPPPDRKVWEAAPIEGLITDVLVADEAGGQVLPQGYHVAEVANEFARLPNWKLPREIS